MPPVAAVAARPESFRLPLTPEARLLLLTAGGPAADAELRALLKGDVNWGRLAILAEWERAAFVVWERLSALCGPAGLPQAAAPLRKLAMVAEFKARYLAQRLEASLAALDGRMDVVLLKGAALAMTLYRSFPARPMLDLDLLVEEAQAEEAQMLLMRAGWVRQYVGRFTEFYRGHQHLPPLDDARGTGVRLEIHTALFGSGNPFHISADAVRAAATPIPGWATARAPDLCHLLLHACLHFAWSHMLSRGSWRAFRDVQVITAGTTPDWARFVELANESSGATCCYWTLRLAATVIGATVPEEVIEALRPPLPEPVRQSVERHFILHLIPAESYCPSETIVRGMWRVGVCPGRSGHGPARPWHRDDEFATAEGHESPTTRSRFAHHLGNLGAWSRYVRSLATRSAG